MRIGVITPAWRIYELFVEGRLVETIRLASDEDWLMPEQIEDFRTGRTFAAARTSLRKNSAPQREARR
jgi:hypothetical protein